MAGRILDELEAVQAFGQRGGDRAVTCQKVVPAGRLAGAP
jgi:hypothetical protein